jgi:PEGA domain
MRFATRWANRAVNDRHCTCKSVHATARKTQYTQSVEGCPSCQSRRWLRPRRAPWFAWIAKPLTARRPYICDACGWHGWRTPLLAARIFAELPPQTRASTKVDPLSSTVDDGARSCDSLEMFEFENTACQESIPEHQPESLRQAAPIELTPRTGSSTAPWLPRALSHARRLLHRVAHERFVSGMSGYQLRRLDVSRSEVMRASGVFALGLAAGAFVVWNASQSALQAPSADAPSPMATSGTTVTRPAEPPPQSRLGSPIASVGRNPSVAPPLQAARPHTRDRQRVAFVSGRPAPFQPERRRTQPAAQSTQVGLRTTAGGTLARSRGSVAIDSIPPGARVLVDGRQVGSTPLVLEDVPAGTHLVRVEADGYSVWAWTVRVVANQRSRVTVKLNGTGTDSLPDFASPAKTP